MRKVLINGVLFWVLAILMPGVEVTSWIGAIIAAFVYGLLSSWVEPVLKFFAFPINLLSFGLVNVLINGLVLYMTSGLSGLNIRNYFTAVIAAIVLGFLQGIVQRHDEKSARS